MKPIIIISPMESGGYSWKFRGARGDIIFETIWRFRKYTTAKKNIERVKKQFLDAIIF